MNFEQEIITLLSSSNFLIYVLTEEEERFEYILNTISKKLFKQYINSWDFIEGYNKKAQRNPLEALNYIEETENENKKIFLLKDFSFFINDLSIIRKIKNISKWTKKNNKYIIFLSTEILIPETLQEYITLLKFPLPNHKEIKIELDRLIKISTKQNPILVQEITNAYKGFSIDRIRKSLSKITFNKKITNQTIHNILKEKKDFIEKTNLLDFYYSNKNLTDIAGLKYLKEWLKVRTNAFSLKAYNYGLKYPKGILLVGIQGTGKSLSAKAIAREWKLPLLKLNISKVFAGILGESESKIQKIINICEKMSPCVLWIDEIEKIFYHSNTNNDSGTTNRINNIFLTWLAEKDNSVFIIGTANNLQNLPIEILRKGRFDEIFFINLPNFEERMNIFKIHLNKVRPLTWHKYNIYYLSQISIYFSGAEIEQAIINSMYNGFYENREFDTEDIILSIKSIIPLAYTKSIDIIKLQEWAKSGKIRLA